MTHKLVMSETDCAVLQAHVQPLLTNGANAKCSLTED